MDTTRIFAESITCAECGGSGVVVADGTRYHCVERWTCVVCYGTGWVNLVEVEKDSNEQ